MKIAQLLRAFARREGTVTTAVQEHANPHDFETRLSHVEGNRLTILQGFGAIMSASGVFGGLAAFFYTRLETQVFELRNDNKQLRNEVTRTHQELRNEVTRTHQELRNEINHSNQELRKEMNAGFESINNTIHKSITNLYALKSSENITPSVSQNNPPKVTTATPIAKPT